jgi:hypothetical protein
MTLTAAPQLVDGTVRLRIDPTGQIGGVPARWHDEVAAVVRRPALTPPAIVLALAQPADAERGRGPATSDAGVHLVEPLGRVLLDARPTFRWRGPAGARYAVVIYDSRYRRVVASGSLRVESWRPPMPLVRGELLNWTLDVTLPDGAELRFPAPPAPTATIEVAAVATADEIAAARATGSHLLAGLALWRTGLLDEGAAELAALARENPLSDLARELARSSAEAVRRLGDQQQVRPPEHSDLRRYLRAPDASQ